MSTRNRNLFNAAAAAPQRTGVDAAVLQTSALGLVLVLVLIISLTGSGYV